MPRFSFVSFVTYGILILTILSFIVFRGRTLLRSDLSKMTLGQKIDLSENSQTYLPVNINPETKTLFSQKVVQVRKTIPFITQEVKDGSLEKGKREVRTIGVPGLLTQDHDVSFWNQTEVGRRLINEVRIEPINQIIAIGTKVIIRNLTAGDDIFNYSEVFRMLATSYDGNCRGCLGKTFSGKEVKKGSCAVDPSVIPLGSWLYVESYGTCKAEDIGGAVKGLKVDLGFEDASLGGWSARFTTVYLLVP